MKLLPLYRTTVDYDSFKLSNFVSSLLGGHDDQDSINDNVAYAVAHDVCQEVLEGDENGDKQFASILEFLQLISFRCKGFLMKRFQGAQMVDVNFLVCFT